MHAFLRAPGVSGRGADREEGGWGLRGQSEVDSGAHSSVCLCCVTLNKILAEPALQAEMDRDTLRALTSAGSVSSCDAH